MMATPYQQLDKARKEEGENRRRAVGWEQRSGPVSTLPAQWGKLSRMVYWFSTEASFPQLPQSPSRALLKAGRRKINSMGEKIRLVSFGCNLRLAS